MDGYGETEHLFADGVTDKEIVVRLIMVLHKSRVSNEKLVNGIVYFLPFLQWGDVFLGIAGPDRFDFTEKRTVGFDRTATGGELVFVVFITSWQKDGKRQYG